MSGRVEQASARVSPQKQQAAQTKKDRYTEEYGSDPGESVQQQHTSSHRLVFSRDNHSSVVISRIGVVERTELKHPARPVRRSRNVRRT